MLIMKKIIVVAGTRPNFIKVAPIVAELEKHNSWCDVNLIHTGQHYDEKMSHAFFDNLLIPPPSINLNVGSATHSKQTAQIMTKFEVVCENYKPDLVIVVGDVNSTMACAITSKKLGIVVAHVESGLRSNDMTMPEEINRLCTDVISDYLFTTDEIATNNLIREGINSNRIFHVGNVMIDSLRKNSAKANLSTTLDQHGLSRRNYFLMTLHRPSNVDNEKKLNDILSAMHLISKTIPVVFPIHPRTKQKINQFSLTRFFTTLPGNTGIIGLEPQNYHDFLNLLQNCKAVYTDSGGLQEEAMALDVPCITLRENTERPITITQGTNKIVGINPKLMLKCASKILSNDWKRTTVPVLWDGYAAKRIVDHLRNLL